MEESRFDMSFPLAEELQVTTKKLIWSEKWTSDKNKNSFAICYAANKLLEKGYNLKNVRILTYDFNMTLFTM